MHHVMNNEKLDGNEMNDGVKNKSQVGSDREPFAAEVPGRQPVHSSRRGRRGVVGGQKPREGVPMRPEPQVLRPVPTEVQLWLGQRSFLAGGENS